LQKPKKKRAACGLGKEGKSHFCFVEERVLPKGEFVRKNKAPRLAKGGGKKLLKKRRGTKKRKACTSGPGGEPFIASQKKIYSTLFGGGKGRNVMKAGGSNVCDLPKKGSKPRKKQTRPSKGKKRTRGSTRCPKKGKTFVYGLKK